MRYKERLYMIVRIILSLVNYLLDNKHHIEMKQRKLEAKHYEAICSYISFFH
jgi:hypothetical protein